MTTNPVWYENEKKNPRVGIAISAMGHMLLPFAESLTELINESIANGLLVDLVIDTSKPLDTSRNNCVKKLLGNGADYIFFMDSDMTFPPDALLKLMKQDKDIITGIYCYKSLPHSPVIKILNEKEKRYARVWEYPRDKLFKVDGCGAGCLLVKKSVFENLASPWFVWKNEITEDFYFCRMATEKGYDIWVDGRIECGHIRQTAVMPRNFWQKQETLRQTLAEKNSSYIITDYDGETEEPKN